MTPSFENGGDKERRALKPHGDIGKNPLKRIREPSNTLERVSTWFSRRFQTTAAARTPRIDSAVERARDVW